MKAKLFRLGCGVLIAALLASTAGCGGKTDGEQTTALIPDETTAAQTTAAEETTTAAAAADDPLKKAQEGDTVTFGAFEQDNNDANGKEPIEWIVLAKREDALLLLSRRALSSRPYHISEDETVTWETCTLRQWLNDEFYKAAFSEQEQAQIKTTAVANEDNPEYGTPGGRNTEDKVFLLSLAENQQYASSDETRIHTPTAAAIAQGFDDETPGEQDGCSWWLRSPGDFKGSACLVTQFGVAHNLGSYSNRKNGVVPALWVETQPAPAETTQRPAATEAPAAQKASAEWAGAYQNYLLDVLAKMEEEDYDNDDFRFGLIELNDDDVPELSCDPERMRQVFLNILDNAAKHGGEGKKITASLRREGDQAVFCIRDYGPGIPPEELPLVKKKFYKGSSKARGSGIGLAVCEEIVTMHGGKLELSNAEGGGALVTVRLPIEA